MACASLLVEGGQLVLLLGLLLLGAGSLGPGRLDPGGRGAGGLTHLHPLQDYAAAAAACNSCSHGSTAYGAGSWRRLRVIPIIRK